MIVPSARCSSGAAAGPAHAVEQRACRRAPARAARPPSRRRRRGAIAIVLPDAALTEITAARIGLAHGRVDEAERAADEQPRGEAVAGRARPEARQARQRRLQARGHVRQQQRERRTRAARRSPGRAAGRCPGRRRRPRWRAPTIVTVNVIDSPSTMPSGRRRPPTPPADSSAGSTGSTHGDSAVPAPARTAKPIRTIICSAIQSAGRPAVHARSLARAAAQAAGGGAQRAPRSRCRGSARCTASSRPAAR